MRSNVYTQQTRAIERDLGLIMEQRQGQGNTQTTIIVKALVLLRMTFAREEQMLGGCEVGMRKRKLSGDGVEG